MVHICLKNHIISMSKVLERYAGKLADDDFERVVMGRERNSE